MYVSLTRSRTGNKGYWSLHAPKSLANNLCGASNIMHGLADIEHGAADIILFLSNIMLDPDDIAFIRTHKRNQEGDQGGP